MRGERSESGRKGAASVVASVVLCPTTVASVVVGPIDQMELDDGNNVDKNSRSIPDSKSVVRPFDAEKSKGKRKLYVGSQALGYCRDHMEVLSPIKDGVVVDWDIVENIWDHALRSCLGCQVIGRPKLDGLRLALPPATRNFAVDGYVPNPH
ncbi:hypothetical protein RHMOL_Rhmol07G0252100 [Rhododendron molle]|uniref:Uncharacterized protein n=1 Tax=Rhododendron molle TaxID=49168 RepID=A0ACC0N4Z2_RHOML|nr:hypothetical protein RHMOL_Rhmol07G0252100 [Rhododendron molle]